jgi:sulfur-oxidizing protein SoxZ
MTTPANRTRVTVPALVKANDVIEVKALINHVMETGQRRDREGNLVPRNIINTMRALYRGDTVFVAELHPSLSANPYIAFNLRVSEPGDLQVIWTDDKERSITETVAISFVSP